MAKQNNNQDNNNNNNFFNNNPLLAFAIFSIVIIMIFKSFVGDSGGLGNMLDSNNVTQTKSVKYSEIKSEIAKGTITSVKLTPTTIEAIADLDGRKTRFVAQNVPTYDKELIPLLEEKNIDRKSGV